MRWPAVRRWESQTRRLSLAWASRGGYGTRMAQDESKLPLFSSTVSEDLLLGVGADVPLSAEEDPERIAGIAAEFKMGFEALAGVQRGVSIFGSARTPSTDPDYIRARAIAAELGRNGYSVI